MLSIRLISKRLQPSLSAMRYIQTSAQTHTLSVSLTHNLPTFLTATATSLPKITKENVSQDTLPLCQLQYSNGSGQLGDLGSGAGKGGGGGGAIREAGGAFGKREAAKEEEYFYRKQKEQLTKLKSDLEDEISFHEEQIKRHQEAIRRHKKRVEGIDDN